MGTLSLTNMAMVTSGTYESFQKGATRYHHLLDPRTGPVQNSLRNVTLLGTSAMELDALSTAVFVLGINASSRLITKSDLQAVFINNEMNVFTTKGLVGELSIPQ